MTSTKINPQPSTQPIPHPRPQPLSLRLSFPSVFINKKFKQYKNQYPIHTSTLNLTIITNNPEGSIQINQLNCPEKILFDQLLILQYSDSLQFNYYTTTMFQQEMEGEDNGRGRVESNKERSQRMRKMRNIRKEKVSQRRSQALEEDSGDRSELTREQRKHLQKQKNRIAAQHSRDRQKKYLEDLETKISQMEKQIESQLCRKCRASLSDHSTSEQQHHEESLYESLTKSAALEAENSAIDIMNFEKEVEELPFVRTSSRTDLEWGNIGKYFCVFLVVLSVALLSSSIETTGGGEFSPVRPVARILTENKNVCEQINEKVSPVTSPLTLEQAKMEHWPFKKGTGEQVEQCKNEFWQHYFKDIRKNISSSIANPYDWNLVTCSSPNLVHISTVYEKSVSHLEDKWTFLITNPIVSQVLAQNNGGYSIDDVSYLNGVYQLIAERVVLKKVMGESCLT